MLVQTIKLVFLFVVKLLLPWKEISAGKISVSQDKSKPLFQSLKILDIYELNMYLIALFMYSYLAIICQNLLTIILF